MLDFRSYKASVQVNGQDLPIYRPEYDEDTKTATCWIASEDGEKFTIFCEQDKSLPHSTGVKVYLDGHKNCATSCVWRDKHQNRIKGVRVSPTARRPFLFASLETTDDDAYLDRTLDLKAPGTIRLQIYRVLITGSTKWKPYQIPETASVVHERSKKAGGHITQFGKQKTVDYASTACLTEPYTPSDTSPWVSFEFRYRPAAILQAEGIMPKPQASLPESQGSGESDEEAEAAHKAEILALEAEQAALDARKAALNAKFGRPNIKREASPIRVPRNTRWTVIDLTLDD
ncbi:hypothetical protein FS837_010381 [Tulasnella sp. UAMH 9824]|nr:hypothetical protein FS837_010381 [Tulasnella sp. UAMH 9824]